MLYFPAKLPTLQRPKVRKASAPIRSAAHLAWVRTHKCSVPGCDGRPIEAAHVRNGLGKEARGTSMKPGDNWTLSLCLRHHKLQTDKGEAWFQRKCGIDMIQTAREFWRRSPYRRRIEAKRCIP